MMNIHRLWMDGLLSDTEALLRIAAVDGTPHDNREALEQLRAIALEMDKRESKNRLDTFRRFLEIEGVESACNRTVIIECLVTLFAMNQIFWNPGDDIFTLSDNSGVIE